MLWRTLRRLKYGHQYDKIGAAEELGRSDNERALVGLVCAVTDKSSEVREAVAASLRSIIRRNPSLFSQCFPALRKALAPKDRTAAMATLRNVCPHAIDGSSCVIDDLLLALKHSDPQVREQAAKGLIGTTDHRALEHLSQHIDDDGLAVRNAVAMALMRSPEIQTLSPEIIAGALAIQQKQYLSDSRAQKEQELQESQRKLLEALRSGNEVAVVRGGSQVLGAIGPVLVGVLGGQRVAGITEDKALWVLLAFGSLALPLVPKLPLFRHWSLSSQIFEFIGKYGASDAAISIVLSYLREESIEIQVPKALASLRLVLTRAIKSLPATCLRELAELPDIVRDRWIPATFFDDGETVLSEAGVIKDGDHFSCADVRETARFEVTRRDSSPLHVTSRAEPVSQTEDKPATHSSTESEGEFWWT